MKFSPDFNALAELQAIDGFRMDEIVADAFDESRLNYRDHTTESILREFASQLAALLDISEEDALEKLGSAIVAYEDDRQSERYADMVAAIRKDAGGEEAPKRSLGFRPVFQGGIPEKGDRFAVRDETGTAWLHGNGDTVEVTVKNVSQNTPMTSRGPGEGDHRVILTLEDDTGAEHVIRTWKSQFAPQVA